MILKKYFLRERTILIILADVLVIYGVLFLDFNVARMYGFYYIDFSAFLIAYSIFNLINDKKLDASSIITATIFMLILIGFFIFFAISLVLPTQLKSLQDVLNIFYPYYDVPIFTALVIRGDYIMFKVSLNSIKMLPS